MRSSSAPNGESERLTFGKVLRRLPLYVGFALASLLVVTVVVFAAIHFGFTNYLTGGWIGFVGYTGLLFWIIVREGKAHWYRWRYWLAVSAMLVTHSWIFVSILRVYPNWRMIWFWPITVVEGGILGAAIEWFFPERHTRRHR